MIELYMSLYFELLIFKTRLIYFRTNDDERCSATSASTHLFISGINYETIDSGTNIFLFVYSLKRIACVISSKLWTFNSTIDRST